MFFTAFPFPKKSVRDKDPLCVDLEYDNFQIFVSAEWIPSWITLQIYRKRFGIFMKCVWALLLLTSFIICRDLIKGNHYYFDLYKKKENRVAYIDRSWFKFTPIYENLKPFTYHQNSE